MKNILFSEWSNTNNGAFLIRTNQMFPFLKFRCFLLNIVWLVIILAVLDVHLCCSEQIDTDLAQKLLVPNDDKFRNLTQLFDRCFDHNHRLLTVVVQGKSLPDSVLCHIHSRNMSYPVIFMTNDEFEAENGRFSETLHQSSDTFILFVDKMDETEAALNKIKSFPLWNARGRFMLIVSHPLRSVRRNVIEETFKRLWEENILQVVLICRFSSSDQCNEDSKNCSALTLNQVVLTYNPFRGITYNKDISNIWPRSSNLDIFFPSLSDLHGYPLRVSMFPATLSVHPILGPDGQVESFEGYDGHTVTSLAQYMNAVLVLLPQKDRAMFGQKFQNGTITGTIGDVAYGRADIASNSQYIKTEGFELEYTYPHDTNNLCFIVPKSKRVPPFRNMFLSFSCSVWTVLACAMFLTPQCWYCIRKYGRISVKEKTNNITMNDAFFDIFRSFISGTLNTVPTSVLERVFIITWVLVGIIITNAFQGSFTSYLAVPKYLPEIDSLQQLDESGLGIFVSPLVNSYMTLDINDEIMTNLWRKFKYDRNYGLIADRVAWKRDMGAIFNELSFSYYLRSSRYVKDGRPLLHRVKENILSIYSVYSVPRHSPFLPRFNVIISRLVESGFQIKWISDSLHRAALEGEITPVSSFQAAEPAPLSLTHLQTAFYILAIGLLSSTLVFMLPFK
ncbi:uncharacterized protein LOC110829827 [Zootermopsis nevadensis]|uniref:Ionotropic glutamate receptor C-terminal domain-containing protein n=1 Tax=Zootermopsis nevadensis TaxID=136037 RepID=A0A067RH06_ZOONE|nr:uncharacterized protein LOC110829827 [Zootermopsis nevadensis]KDR19584.1 hypothetical protein L798_06382 [Zootermopsis nevadensis]